MKTLTIIIILSLLTKLTPQTHITITEVQNEIKQFNNCTENWPDVWRKHQLCTGYEVYPWRDTVIINTRSLLQNWNTFPFIFSGVLKYVIPPPNALAFNLVIISPLGDTVYNRMAHYQIIGENWSFSIGFLQYVYTDENIILLNPVPGLYSIKSIIKATQFTDHTVNLNFSIDNPVPVELTNFTGKIIGRDIVLNWTTITEINNYGFEIERQIENNGFEIIGFVPGNNISNSPKFYNFVDANVLPGNYSYRLKQIDTEGGYKYSEIISMSVQPPTIYALEQNYPNSFNSVTIIRYQLPEASQVKITVYNLLGQEVKNLINKHQFSGVYEVKFDASDMNSGIYIYQLQAGIFQETKKMILIK